MKPKKYHDRDQHQRERETEEGRWNDEGGHALDPKRQAERDEERLENDSEDFKDLVEGK